MSTAKKTTARIAIVGAGPAGLVAARVVQRDLGVVPVVFEKEAHIGGVWKYDQKVASTTHPMYRGLRTNLPKEVMAYREYPWKSCEEGEASFVTHNQVLEYLERYADHFSLRSLLQMGATVEKLSIQKGPPSFFQPFQDEVLPTIELEWSIGGSSRKGVFDAVVVCNGHYSKPMIPKLPGLQEHFSGKVLHSITYDDPLVFAGKTVLCIGGRASGADVARELASSGAVPHVYLSDSAKIDGKPVTSDGVTWVPRTVRVKLDGTFQFDLNCPLTPTVDAVVFCTGYDYDFPFISASSDLGLELVEASDRRVSPVFEQLWHARYPNLAFVGLPHGVLPFPMFELQMEAFCRQLKEGKSGGYYLPNLEERKRASKHDATSGGEGKWPNGRVPVDSHFLGDAQWPYCQRMAQYAGLLSSEEAAEACFIAKYLEVNKVCQLLSVFDCCAFSLLIDPFVHRLSCSCRQ